MGRFVKPELPVLLGAAELGPAPRADDRGDGYAARVAKYIPSEVLSAYVAMSAIVSSMNETETLTRVSAWVVFGVGLVFTPVYLGALPKLGRPWIAQALISTAAFAIWAYALGGPFKLSGLYSPQIGGILLIVFTLAAGLYQPRPEARPS